MADRTNFFYKQKVTETELDLAFDGVEKAVFNLVKDIDMFGVVLNGEVSENAPQNLTVDVNGPGTCYDQAGQRIYWGVTQDVDCEEDYLGNPTVPTTPGQSVWLSLHARFDRNLQDQRTDGSGDPVWWIRAESFELRVVAGTAATTGTHTKPAKPTDAVLLADIELDYNQTAIADADIDTTRRDDFLWTTGANIGVDDSGWANIGPAADVQAAFDSVDDVVLDRDGTGDITEDIVPAALGQFLGEGGTPWDAYLRNTTISGPITPATDGIDIGNASNRVDIHVYEGICYSLLRPDATGRNLGDATRRWDAYLEDVTVYGTAGLLPSASGKALGSASARWVGHCNTLTLYSAGYASVLQFESARTVDKELDLDRLAQNSWASDWWQWSYGATWGTRGIYGWTMSASATRKALIELDLPHGVTVTDLLLTWYQAGGAAAFAAEAFYVSNNGTETSLGSKTISSTGAWKDKEAMGLDDFEVDRNSYKYILVIDTPASQDCAFTGVVAQWSVQDIGKAII